jgi:hypothetical protein
VHSKVQALVVAIKHGKVSTVDVSEENAEADDEENEVELS